MVVSAPLEDSEGTGVYNEDPGAVQFTTTRTDSGAVYVFRRDKKTGVWAQEAYIKPELTSSYTYYGQDLALSGDGTRLAVSLQDNSAATGIDGDPADITAFDSGAVYVYRHTPTSGWARDAYIKASNTGEGDDFGDSMDLNQDGSVLVVGAAGEDSDATQIGGDGNNDDNPGQGAAYIFERVNNTWRESAYVKAATVGFASFGRSVAIDDAGETVVVGATGMPSFSGDDKAGRIYVFAADPWAQTAVLEANAPEGRRFLGRAVAISGDGTTIAAGLEHEAQVFSEEGGLWEWQGTVSAPVFDAFDGFGEVLTLSNDGQTLAVGASGEDGGSTGIGGDPTDNSEMGSGAVFLY